MTISARIIPAHRRVYEFIVAYKRQHDGNAPTMQEIGDACFLGKTTVFFHLQQLEKHGLIRRPEPKLGNRYCQKIEIVGGHWNLKESQ